jgi:hypothetical protein
MSDRQIERERDERERYQYNNHYSSTQLSLRSRRRCCYHQSHTYDCMIVWYDLTYICILFIIPTTIYLARKKMLMSTTITNESNHDDHHDTMTTFFSKNHANDTTLWCSALFIVDRRRQTQINNQQKMQGRVQYSSRYLPTLQWLFLTGCFTMLWVQ